MGSKALQRKRDQKRTFRRLTPAERQDMASRAVYEGSPHHKRDPNSFGLSPPAAPRPDKTLCDEAGITEKELGRAIFQRALEFGLVSESRMPDGLPKHLWVLDGQDRVFEAIYGGSRPGAYHGYPVREGDPLAQRVRSAFQAEANESDASEPAVSPAADSGAGSSDHE